MSVRLQNNVAYGLTDALLNVPLLPIVANRPPASNDMAPIGTIWIYKAQNLAYVITSIVNNEATWVQIAQSGGDFVRFNVQTVDDTPTAIATFPIAASSAVDIQCNVVAAQNDFTGAGTWLTQAVARREAAGAPIIVNDSQAELVANEDFSGGDPDVNFAIVGNTVELQVTGIAATTINWVTDVTTISIT